MRSEEGVAVLADGGVQRHVGARQPGVHQGHVLARHADGGGDAAVDLGADLLLGRLHQPGAQAPQVEEQGLLGRTRPAAHDRPVAQDVVLDRGADPPRGVGREAHVPLRLEPGGGLHQADMALLDEVGHRQAVMAEAAGERDHEAHVGGDQAVQGALVAGLLPGHRQPTLFFPRKERRLHRCSNELTPHPRDLCHARLSRERFWIGPRDDAVRFKSPQVRTRTHPGRAIRGSVTTIDRRGGSLRARGTDHKKFKRHAQEA